MDKDVDVPEPMLLEQEDMWDEIYRELKRSMAEREYEKKWKESS